ncbi:MAG TPA: HlyD family efflux transporter periplasmic adaptor subunit [Thioploca sp.]|nr:HlyD family efflux transporter periplasmic adaptor subunit [Thioploca sp.]
MKKIILPILILAISIFGFRYMLKTKSKTGAIEITEPAWIVATTPVILETLSPTVTLYGRVESPKTSTLRSPNLNAQVLQVKVLEGEKVNKNDILIRLEDSDSILKLKQQVADIKDISAQITLEKQRHANNLTIITHEESLLKLAKKSLERLRKLAKQKASSQSALDESQQLVERQTLTIIQRKLEIKNHKARLNQLQAKQIRAKALQDIAKLELARTKITAPFTGIIVEVKVAVGDRVRSGDILLSMYDNSVLEVRTQIPTRYQDIVMNSTNISAIAKLNSKSLTLTLDRISGQINQNSGGIDGLFKLSQPANLRLGQFLTLLLTLPKQTNVVALPYEAVYGMNHIYKLVDGRMQGLKIERIGEQVIDGKSKILVRSSNLQYGEQIIITQLPNAMDGLKVKTAQPN